MGNLFERENFLRRKKQNSFFHLNLEVILKYSTLFLKKIILSLLNTFKIIHQIEDHTQNLAYKLLF